MKTIIYIKFKACRAADDKKFKIEWI